LCEVSSQTKHIYYLVNKPTERKKLNLENNKIFVAVICVFLIYLQFPLFFVGNKMHYENRLFKRISISIELLRVKSNL